MQAKDIFKALFYEWIQKDVEREVNSNFYFIRQIKGSLAINSYNYFNTLDDNDKMAHLKSISNKFLQGKNGDLLNRYPSEIDKERWLEFRKSVFVNPPKNEVIEGFYKEESLKRRRELDRKRLRKEIKTTCSLYLGKPFRSRGDVFSYRALINGFSITTEFDLGGWSQLRYLHGIHFENSSSDKLEFILMADLMRWLGLGETAWEYMTDEDIPNTVKVLGELCSHFMANIEKIIFDSIKGT